MSGTQQAPSVSIAPNLVESIGLHAWSETRRMLRISRQWPSLLVVLSATVVGAAGAHFAPADLLAAPDFFRTVCLRAIALLAIGYATAALRADADRGALALYLVRPRASLALPLGRLVATTGVIAVTGVLFACLLFGATAAVAVAPDIGHLPLMCLAAVLAAVGYTPLFMAVAAYFKRAAAICVAWFVVVDLMLASATTSFATFAPGPAVQTVAARYPDPHWYSDVLLAPIGQVFAIGAIATALLLWKFAADEPG